MAPAAETAVAGIVAADSLDPDTEAVPAFEAGTAAVGTVAAGIAVADSPDPDIAAVPASSAGTVVAGTVVADSRDPDIEAAPASEAGTVVADSRDPDIEADLASAVVPAFEAAPIDSCKNSAADYRNMPAPVEQDQNTAYQADH